MFSVVGGSDSLFVVLFGWHCLDYPIIGLVGNYVKLRTPGTPWYPILLPTYSSNSATYTLVTYEFVLPSIADFVGSTNF